MEEVALEGGVVNDRGEGADWPSSVGRSPKPVIDNQNVSKPTIPPACRLMASSGLSIRVNATMYGHPCQTAHLQPSRST